MGNGYVELLIDTLKSERHSVATALTGGMAKDYAEYREMTGRIRGLDQAVGAAEDLAQKLTDADDD